MTDMMDYFNNPDVGSKDQEDDVEFANVTGLVLGRNDSYHNIEMGFKDPDNPSPSKGPSRSISVSHDPSERQVNDAQIGSVTVCDDAFSPELSPVAVAAKKSPAGQPKPLDSYDFSYSADSHDSPSDKGVPGENKYVRQASSPILDHLIENLSDVDESIPKVDSKHTEDHEGDISQFMQSIPSKFDKPKISPRLAEKAEVRRKSLAQDQAVAGMSRQPEQEGNRHPNIPEDPEDMAVIMANKEKKKKKKSSDSYMDEFEVVAAGKKPTQTASKDHDSLDMKNKQPRHRKNNDSYLSDIPVVKVSDTKKSPRQERKDKVPEVRESNKLNSKNENNLPPVHKKIRAQKPTNDSYLSEIPVVRAQKSSLEGDRDGRSSYEELELKRKAVAKAAPSKVRESGQSPDRIKPQPPTTRKPSGGRPDPLVVLPRLVQSDQTNVRNKKIDNIGSRDDSNEYNDEDRPKRKRKKPLFMRLQAKAERQAGEIEREKMAAYALLREQKKLAQPSHQDLLEHRQKYAELKKEEEQRKKEAREYRENEWRNMQQMLQQKNEAVVPHVPSHSPLKRNASDVNASDDESLHSHVSQKKKKRPRRRSRAASDVTGDEDSIDSAARREDDLYLPNIVSPAKLSPRGIGKARRAKRREEENSNDGENQAPSNLNHAINEGESPPRVPKKEKKQVRLPPDVRPEPIHTEDSVDSNGNHVRFAENATRKSHDSDVSHDSKSSLSVANVPILRGPQYLAELLEPDQQEEDLAKMYETGFEMQMVERGMMETPSAAKALAGAQGRVPR